MFFILVMATQDDHRDFIDDESCYCDINGLVEYDGDRIQESLGTFD